MLDLALEDSFMPPVPVPDTVLGFDGLYVVPFGPLEEEEVVDGNLVDPKPGTVAGAELGAVDVQDGADEEDWEVPLDRPLVPEEAESVE